MFNLIQSIEFRRGEVAVRESLTYLVVDGRFYSGKYGRLTVTEQRLLWAPLRLSFLRTTLLEIELSNIERCEVQVRNLGPSALVVDVNEHSLAFQIVGSLWNPFGKKEDPEDWRELIASRAGLDAVR